MMELVENKSSELKLDLTGYQFPEAENEPYDADWLNVTIRVKHPRGSWTTTDPSLLTYEVKRLAAWFEALADGRIVEPEQGFIEPNLAFGFDHGTSKLRVYFELESRPSWAAADVAGLEDLWLEFSVTPEMLRRAAASLRSQLESFPARTSL